MGMFDISHEERLELIRQILAPDSKITSVGLRQARGFGMWLYKEFAHDVVYFCEEVLGTGHLKLKIKEKSYGTKNQIRYKGEKHWLPFFDEEDIETPTTLYCLNEIIKEDFSIRLWEGSKDEKIKVYMPLLNSDWKMLEDEFGKETVSKSFSLIPKSEQLIRHEL